MKITTTILAFVLGLAMANAQNSSFTYDVQGNTVKTLNTSDLPISPVDSFGADWFFLGEGTMLYSSFDSSSFEFLTGGSYLVGLTISHYVKSVESPDTWVRKQDTLLSIQTITVGGNASFQISGKVMWKGQQVENGGVHLLKKTNGEYKQVRFANIDQNGDFLFSNLSTDTFIIWALPIICDTCTLNPSNIIPTYSGNTTEMNAASMLVTSTTISNYVIDMVEPAPLNGLFSISGKVIKNTSPAGNLAVLLTSSDKTKSYRFSIAELVTGNYALNNISSGTYMVQPIVDGIPYTPITVNVTSNEVLDIDLSPIAASIFERVNSVGVNLKAYPNPFTTTLFISSGLNENFKSVAIMNTNGQLVYSSQNEGETELNLEALANGIYMIRVEMINGGFETLRVLKN